MTGGQMAPTTLLGQVTATTPYGRKAELNGYPLKITELIAQLEGTCYVTRQSAQTPAAIRKTKNAIRKAFENSAMNKGTSFIEVVCTCNSNWKLSPVKSIKWMEENMFPFYKLGDRKDRYLFNVYINQKIFNMKEEIIIAGFGGQGVLSMGKILAYSGIMQNKEVTWMPSYGPEMRGGTANVTVILSDKKISSPILSKYDTAIILNQQSMDKFEPLVKPGGLLLYDPNGITRHPVRKDITVCSIAAADESAMMGNAKAFNMIVLGAFLKKKPIVEMENVILGLKHSLPERAHKLIPMNEAAIKLGMEKIKDINVL